MCVQSHTGSLARVLQMYTYLLLVVATTTESACYIYVIIYVVVYRRGGVESLSKRNRGI